MTIAFLLAMGVRSRLVSWTRGYKPLLFLPQVMAPVAAGIVWRVILSHGGMVNKLTGTNTDWLADPARIKWAVCMLLVWRGVGWYFIVFLAGLTGISTEVLEAASVDGTNAWQRMRYVVLPMMRPILLFAIVIDTVASLQLFTEPNILTGAAGSTSAAPPSAEPIMNLVLNNVTGGQLGLASAVGWVVFAGIGVFSALQFRLFRSEA
jgi:ABC-type sugar transport system permease subunit